MKDIKKILQQLRSMASENEVVEFKEAKNGYDFKKLGKYFSALSNEANLNHVESAWLVFGIKDKDKSIVGTSFRSDNTHLMSLKSEIAQHTTNNITFVEIHEVIEPEGRILLFEIPATPRGIPMAWQGHYYGRNDEVLTGLNIEKIERIRNQKTRQDWSIEICEEASIQDLSTAAIAKAREAFKTKNQHLKAEIDTWSDKTFLNKAKVCINGKITNTAILLLGKPESEHFISPALAHITWILKDKDNIEKDYEHFSCPFILSVDKVFAKIRNLKYRYMRDENTLFPEEVNQYEPYIIREALHNCIAHQDYRKANRIIVIESEDDKIIFVNGGTFLPETVENVLNIDAPQLDYRNDFLVNAMVNLNMIDTIGSGIRRMFIMQKNKFFPLPDYDFSDGNVKMTVIGKILDINYARKLAQMPNLSLNDILLLDKVQKRKILSNEALKYLRKKKLVEGRKNNLYISSNVAKETGQKEDYIKMQGFDNQYYKELILKYLTEFEEATKQDIEKLILDKLPNILSVEQKKNKIKYILYSMSKKDKTIENKGSNRYAKWVKL